MKYLILTYGTQRDYDLMSGAGAGTGPAPEEFAPMHAFMQEFATELARSGELVDTKGLAAPVHTRRVQLQAGVPVVTEGPYAETQEVLAGYWLVDVASFDRATEIAARLAACPSPGGIFADAVADIRPVDEFGGEPEL
ncbi:YciI family protein [Jiangella endophytica]|uniref:YciI family protein n=1 Tax=Jiangella endophytica TaxID=1623398 RepID=UPI000E356D98|nr:YciI family protein [Jiangella endophytica]